MATMAELLDLNSARSWEADGPNQLVKIVNSAGAIKVREYRSIMGYVTQEKYLYGRTSGEIGTLLGLRPGERRLGAWVFLMARLPLLGEYQYRFSLGFPAGRVFGSDELRKAMQERRKYFGGQATYIRSHSETAQYYPPGSDMIPQWELTKPVPLGTLISVVTETLPLQRDGGSTLPYTPYNKGLVRLAGAANSRHRGQSRKIQNGLRTFRKICSNPPRSIGVVGRLRSIPSRSGCGATEPQRPSNVSLSGTTIL